MFLSIIIILAFGNWALAEMPLQVQSTKVGTLWSPIAFGFIRIEVNCDHLLEQVQKLEVQANLMERKVEKSGGAGVLNSTKAFNKVYKQRIQEEKNRIIHLQQTICPSDSTEERPKRFAGAAIAAAGTAGIVLSVAALGLGIANRIELDRLAAGQAELVESVDILTQTVNSNFDAIERTVNNLTREIEIMKLQQSIDEYKTNAKMGIRRIANKVDEIHRGYYAALRGQLDAGLVPIPQLEEGLRLVKNSAAKQGLAPVSFELPLQQAFAEKITAFSSTKGLQLVVAVPLKPIVSPKFELLQITVTPIRIPDSDLMVEYGLEELFIAVDQERLLHRPYSSLDLLKCTKVFPETFLCKEKLFNHKPSSCAAGLLFHDAQAVKEFCVRHFSKPHLTAHKKKGGLAVWTPEEKLIKKYCGLKESAELILINGLYQVNVTSGCYLKTDAETIFFADDIAVQEGVDEEANLDLVLDSVSTTDVSAMIEELKLTHIRISPSNVDYRRRDGLFRTWQVIAAISLAISLAIILLVCARYLYLARRWKTDVEKDEDENQRENV